MHTRWLTGVAKVLSMTTSAPCSRHSLEMSGTSTHRRYGLVGDSLKNSDTVCSFSTCSNTRLTRLQQGRIAACRLTAPHGQQQAFAWHMIHQFNGRTWPAGEQMQPAPHLLEARVVVGLDDGGGDAHFRQHRLDELAGAAVAVGGGHDVAARRHQRQQHRRRRVHAAAGQQAVLRALQRLPTGVPGDAFLLTLLLVCTGAFSSHVLVAFLHIKLVCSPSWTPAEQFCCWRVAGWHGAAHPDLLLACARRRVAIAPVLVGAVAALLVVDQLLRVAERVRRRLQQACTRVALNWTMDLEGCGSPRTIRASS
jgi:hypothetical protein